MTLLLPCSRNRVCKSPISLLTRMHGRSARACDLAGGLSFDRAAIGLILTAHWLLLHARQPCAQHAASPPSPLTSPPPARPFCSLQPGSNLKCLHLIAQEEEAKPDVNYDRGDNVAADHWRSVSLGDTDEGFNSDGETRRRVHYE